MRGKNGTMAGSGPSIASELNNSMNNLFSDDPLMQGLAMFGNGSMLLSHTPPNITPGSYEISHMKRARAGSISGRLRSASDLEEKGLIDKSQKGVLKDLIISGDSELQIALDLYDRGDASQLEAMMKSGLLDRRDSLDLLQDLDFGIMDLGMSDSDIPDLPEDDINCVMENANRDNPNNTADNGDAIADSNDTIETIRRKDSGGGGGDFGHSAGGGGVKGIGGDGVSTAGGGSSAGGGSVEASAMLQRGAGVAPAVVEGLRRGRSSTRKAAALSSSTDNHDVGSKRGFGDLQARAGEAVSEARPAGARGGVIGVDDSEQEIDLGADGDADQQFDIGDMAFDAAFDYDGQEDDVDMKELQVDESSPLAKVHGATLGPTAVGPLRVVSASQLAAAQAHHAAQQQQEGRRGSNTQDDDRRHHQDGPGSGANVDGPPQDARSAEGSPLSDHHQGAGEQHHHHDEDDHHGNVGVGVEEDDDAAVLASYGILDGGPTAPIGDFSPQFKFSFTDDIHLDLGSGLKDELRDLDSLSEPLPEEQAGKGGESYPPILGLDGPGLAYRHHQHTQLLSRGGPVVKTEPSAAVLSSTSTTSQTTVRLTSAARAAAAPPGTRRLDYSTVAGGTSVGGGNIKRETASPSSVGGAGYYAHGSSTTSSAAAARHTGHHQYGTATGVNTVGVGSMPPGGPHAGAVVGGVMVGASGVPGVHPSHLHSGQVVSHSQQASSTSHGGGAVRGRPVVAGMEIMVGAAPGALNHHQQRAGMTGTGVVGVDGEERKFVGAYSPEARRQRIQRFLEKREHRVWTKMVKYDVRKNFADTRMRVKGRFVKKEDEALLREVMACA